MNKIYFKNGLQVGDKMWLMDKKNDQDEYGK